MNHDLIQIAWRHYQNEPLAVRLHVIGRVLTCPFAALMIIFMKVGNLFGIKRMKVKRNLERCVDCGFCIKSCPMNIDLSESEYIDNYECIVCMRCAISCPKPKTITREYER